MTRMAEGLAYVATRSRRTMGALRRLALPSQRTQRVVGDRSTVPESQDIRPPSAATTRPSATQSVAVGRATARRNSWREPTGETPHLSETGKWAIRQAVGQSTR